MSDRIGQMKKGATMRSISRVAVGIVALSIMLAVPAHAGPDDDGGPSVTDEICGAFDMGVPPGDISGMLHRNDGRWNYWRAQQRTEQTIVGGDCG
jgi:hypothetical protein